MCSICIAWRKRVVKRTDRFSTRVQCEDPFAHVELGEDGSNEFEHF